MRTIFIFFLVWVLSFTAGADELQEFVGVSLIKSSANDGDSFLVKAGKRTIHLRLYFIDCPEGRAVKKVDAERVQDQARYFGLVQPVRVLYFGKAAGAFVDRVLAKPFVVHTAFADAMGRSRAGRVYGFVTTADGDDLASLLVKNGYARVYGLRRKTPAGESGSEMRVVLEDLQTSAILRRIGIWAESDPDMIARLRAEKRDKDKKLAFIRGQKKVADDVNRVFNVNLASRDDLMLIRGIGPVLADRIIADRPYKNIENLLKIKGVGPKTLAKIRSYLIVK
ncbi:MAG: helix-hairpin-helix domain-containing protein [Kiritimatiellae bacterium]|nr:helix-hairpin-helix domain-containing protein [Kiritimatiellia bacterium]